MWAEHDWEVTLTYCSPSVCKLDLNSCLSWNKRINITFRYDGLEFGLRGENTTSTERMFADGRAAGFNHVVRGRILAGNYFLLQDNYEEYFEQAGSSLNDDRSFQQYCLYINRHSKFGGSYLKTSGEPLNPALTSSSLP